MKKLRILKEILVRTRTSEIIVGFFIFILIVGFVISIVEPDIHTWRDGLWYCYAAVTTIGFGDVIVTRPLSKCLSVILSIYAAFVIAIVTGVVVNFYTRLIQLRNEETLEHFMDRLEHLPEMTPEELADMSERVKNFKKKYRKNK